MDSREELSETIEAALMHVGAEGATIERSPSQTIVPASRPLDTTGQRAFELLTRGGHRLEEGFALGGTIGEGGMGIVRLATQHALGRQVAVKTLKSEHKNEESTLKLLREAWVTGGLEHPNVVPVYDIALEADGSPLIVLKKIEGDEWASLIHDAAAVRQRFGAEDLLEWNLRIFMQVCNAVRFAHSRGILHRDLKPENVMIGSFGEVYLVDWGIALSLTDDGASWLPRASEAKEMAGTPVYMAPEMLGGPTSRLGAHTDVYLLGAILYEIVAGAAPHRGEQLMQIVASIVDSSPPLSDDVPAELARVVRRAMDPEPHARFESVEQVRLAVQGFLTHRDAMQLAARAEERLEELRALLAVHTERHDDPETREPIYHLFGQCRFGFRHALEVWPDNVDARDGLDRAIEAMVEYELSQSEPEAARALLGEMAQAPPRLVERVDEARKRRAAEDAELRRVSADLDPNAGRRTRSFVALVLGSLWVMLPLGTGVLVSLEWYEYSNVGHVVSATAMVALLAGIGIWARESLMRTAINRRIGVAAATAVSAQLLAGVLSLALDRSPASTLQEMMLAFAVICVMLAASVDRRLAASAAAYLCGYVLTVVLGQAFYLIAGANLVLLINTLVLWARPEDLSAARDGIERRRAQRRRWLAERFGRG